MIGPRSAPALRKKLEHRHARLKLCCEHQNVTHVWLVGSLTQVPAIVSPERSRPLNTRTGILPVSAIQPLIEANMSPEFAIRLISPGQQHLQQA